MGGCGTVTYSQIYKSANLRLKFGSVVLPGSAFKGGAVFEGEAIPADVIIGGCLRIEDVDDVRQMKKEHLFEDAQKMALLESLGRQRRV